MLNTYSPIETLKGWYLAGICGIMIAPREWMSDPIARDFNTGIIDGIPDLSGAYEYLELELVPESYEYEEKAKTNKQGPFFETHLSGLINNITPELLMTLETLRYHEFVAVLTDRQKRLKFAGDITNGLTLNFSNKESNNQGGLQVVSIEMAMNFEQAAAFITV